MARRKKSFAAVTGKPFSAVATRPLLGPMNKQKKFGIDVVVHRAMSHYEATVCIKVPAGGEATRWSYAKRHRVNQRCNTGKGGSPTAALRVALQKLVTKLK